MVFLLPKKSSNKGFTLIELLVVITIIGILSSIIIVILNPKQKQNMAHDGTIFASINKIVMSTNGFITAYGRAPDESEFIKSLNVTVNELFENQCSYTIIPDYECLFSVQGVTLPHNCDLTFWSGYDSNTQLCNFRYQGRVFDDDQRYRIYVKSKGLPETIFVYDNKMAGKLYECPVEITDFSQLDSHCK